MVRQNGHVSESWLPERSQAAHYDGRSVEIVGSIVAVTVNDDDDDSGGDSSGGDSSE